MRRGGVVEGLNEGVERVVLRGAERCTRCARCERGGVDAMEGGTAKLKMGGLDGVGSQKSRWWEGGLASSSPSSSPASR